METLHNREVVVELEQVKIIRKRARTTLYRCRGCGRKTDFVTLTCAAELFDVEALALFEFLQTARCHYLIADVGVFYICLTDLVVAMSKKVKRGTMKLLEGE